MSTMFKINYTYLEMCIKYFFQKKGKQNWRTKYNF